MLNAAAALSPDDAWAVGGYSLGSVERPLILHWDGSSWQSAPVPDISGSLHGVHAVSANDVWAVGQSTNGGKPSALTLHWDGKAWTPSLSGLNSSTSGIYLESVDATSTNDVWAVGERARGSGLVPASFHWNGSAWKLVPAPTRGGQALLTGVVALSPQDVWAVGTYYIGHESGLFKTYVLHWDGEAWSIERGGVAEAWGGLSAAAAAGPAGVWAVGQPFARGSGPHGSLVAELRNGAWKRVSVSDLPTGNNWIHAVTVVSRDEAWAAGTTQTGVLTSIYRALVAHFDGGRWTTTVLPELGTDTYLTGVAADADGVWIVGHMTKGSTSRTLTLRRCPA